MEQYPPSYPPPPPYPPHLGYYSPPPNYPASPRGASVMLIILGVAMTLFSLCAGASIFGRSDAELQTQLNDSPFHPDMSKLPPGISVVELTRTSCNLIAVGGLVLGPLLVLFGIIVRTGNRSAVVLASVLCGTVIATDVLCWFFGCAGSLVSGMMAVSGLLPSLILGVILALLLRTLRRLPQMQMMQQQQWQWQQQYAASQQQTYNPGAYPPLFGAPAPPPPGQPPYGVPPYGAPPVGGPPQGAPSVGGPVSYGYGAIPQIAPPPDATAPPVRHPPLPPDQQNPPGV